MLHRIVRVEDGRYATKGDNNDFVDSGRASERQIVGRLWFSVPEVGAVTDWVRQPAHSALIVGLATLLALGGFGRTRRRDGSARARSATAASGRIAQLEPVLVGLGVALALSALLAIVSFSRPSTRTEAVQGAYVQQGTVDYSAAVARNPVYPEGRVATGDPVFLKLVYRLRFDFRYDLESRTPVTSAAGRIGLEARLADGRGWERTFVLAPARRFEGTTAAVAGTIDLGEVQRLTDDLLALTGSAQTAYTLTVLPRIELRGSRAGEALEAAFAPSIGFDLGDLRLQPKLEAAGLAGAFAPRELGTTSREVSNTLSIGALEVPVGAARALSVAGLAAGVLLALLGLSAFRRRRGGAEPDQIEARYGKLLLPVASRSQDWARVTELSDFASLVRLAEHYDRMILQLVDAAGHSYVVEEAGSVYRYRVESSEAVSEAVGGAVTPVGDIGRRPGPAPLLRQEAPRR